MIRQKPVSSRERLVSYVEFVLKFGPLDNFDIAGNDLSFIQFYLIDIIVPVLVLILVIVFIVIRIAVYITYKFFLQSKIKEE